MTDPTGTERLLTRTATSGRPVRKDEIELLERGLYIESWLPERRSRRKPLLFVHGELGGSWVWERFLHHFAGRGWEGHALNLRNHFWSQTADPATLDIESYTEDVVAAVERLGPGTVAVGHGMGGLLVLKAIERVPVSAYVLIAPEAPRELREPARPYVVRDIGDAYGRSELGWETLPEKLVRDQRDLTLSDVLRVQHLLGQKPFESGRAKRQLLAGVPVDRGALPDVPRLVIGGGLDTIVPEPGVERLAEWLDAPYEPFGAHSHYGLVRRRAELSAGRGDAPRVPGDQPALGSPRLRARAALGNLCRRSDASDPLLPHSSRGPGHRPLKAEITGSNPVCGTTTTCCGRFDSPQISWCPSRRHNVCDDRDYRYRRSICRARRSEQLAGKCGGLDAVVDPHLAEDGRNQIADRLAGQA